MAGAGDNLVKQYPPATHQFLEVPYIYVLDPAGEVVHDGTDTFESFGKSFDDSAMREVVGSRKPKAWITEEVMNASVPVMIGSEVLGSVRIGVSLREVEGDKETMRALLAAIARQGAKNHLLVSAVVALVLGAVGIGIGVLATRGTTAAVESLKVATEEIGRGHYGTEIPLEREDEIGELGDAIRKMAGDLLENEEKLRHALADAERSSRAKSEFLASMSHELRTPMNAVLGFAQILDSDAASPLTDKQKNYLRYILNSGEHMMNLIEQVLDLASIESGNLELSLRQVDPGTVLTDVLPLFERQARDGRITIDNGCGICACPTLYCDVLRTRQIVVNLISNAIKYNREGGAVTIGCRQSTNGFVRISVQDTGEGIAPERHGELFGSFNRLGREAGTIEGTGIGLSLSKRLTEMMGGQIGFESEVGSGSTFWVDLPTKEVHSS